MQKLLVVLGPTATGKSDLAVILAKKFNGEVISADSRQVYKHLDIATGKITKKEMGGVPHYLLDVASPKRTYTVSQFKKAADKAIRDIHQRGKLPIIAGGTGFYIDAVVDNVLLPEVPPNRQLRQQLEKESLETLVARLQKLDADRAAEIDTNNKVRLIRAIEIAEALGKVPRTKKNRQYDVLKIGLELPEKDLRKNISLRTAKRMKQGMVAEARQLHEQHGVSYKRMRELGLEYRHLADFLQNRITKDGLITSIETGDWQYAKRQMTWWKRDKEIHWYKPSAIQKILSLVRQWL